MLQIGVTCDSQFYLHTSSTFYTLYFTYIFLIPMSPRLDIPSQTSLHTLITLTTTNQKKKKTQLGFPTLPEQPPTAEELQSDEKLLKDLHTLLMETQISEGKLVCGNCGHEYAVREGIANFLLPSHLV
jgi:multifunctional methyltransferase subunit TRM112